MEELFCGADTVVRTDYIVVDANLACNTSLNLPTTGTAGTQMACAGTIYDSGGPLASYGANEFALLTISPIGATSVDLTFISFDLEQTSGACYLDYIDIYDGPSTTSNLIGSYCNANIPSTVSSTGGSITLFFRSNSTFSGDGFRIDWSCNTLTGIDDLKNNEGITSYYNYVSNSVEFSLNKLRKGNYSLLVLNSLGKLIINDNISVFEVEQNEVIRLPNMAKGIYYIKLYGTGVSYSTKFVK